MKKVNNFLQSLSWLLLITASLLLGLQWLNFISLISNSGLLAIITITALASGLFFIEENMDKIADWLNNLGLNQKAIKEYLVSPILVALETIIIYLITIIPAEYLLSEKWLVIRRITDNQKTYYFLAIFLIIFLLNHFFKKAARAGERGWQIIILAFIAALWGNQQYQDYYGQIQNQPRIYSVSDNWTIVAKPITIEGKNFCPAWQAGEVKVNDFSFNVLEWSEEKIVAEQPVSPDYFTGQLYVENCHGKKSNSIVFEILDPGELDN
ncbi:MAG: hypothetical protein ACOYJ8_03355 [Patescibacteria group bacterium]|jgi:hypothetical protein